MGTVLNPGLNVSTRAYASNGYQRHWVFSRNLAAVDAMFLGQPSSHLAHCAHYVDALPPGNDLRAYNVQRYLSAADALGAWG